MLGASRHRTINLNRAPPSLEAWVARPKAAIEGTSTLLYNATMRIHEFVWPQGRVDHIARHEVTPEEVEEACFGRPLVQRAKSEGKNPVYYILGETEAGRYLFCVVIQFPEGKGYTVTARPMADKEKRRYKQWKNA